MPPTICVLFGFQSMFASIYGMTGRFPSCTQLVSMLPTSSNSTTCSTKLHNAMKRHLDSSVFVPPLQIMGLSRPIFESSHPHGDTQRTKYYPRSVAHTTVFPLQQFNITTTNHTRWLRLLMYRSCGVPAPSLGKSRHPRISSHVVPRCHIILPALENAQLEPIFILFIPFHGFFGAYLQLISAVA